MNRARPLWVGLVILLAAGCGPGPVYSWGSYESLLYDMYAKPGSADPATQAAKLQEDIAEAAAKGRRAAPGVHAHLGYMYYLQGDLVGAEAQLRTERELFPESATFVDGMLRRMGAP